MNTRIAGIVGPVVACVFLAGCDGTTTEPEEHFDVRSVAVETLSGTPIASYQNGVWTFPSGDALHLHPGEEADVRIFFVLADGDRVQLPGTGDDHTLAVTVANQTIARFESRGDHGAFVAVGEGETTAAIEAVHGGHADYATNPGLPIEVVDHEDH